VAPLLFVVVALLPEERAAQRSLVGLVRRGAVRVSRADGMCIWRDPTMDPLGVSAADITAHLDALQIRYTAALVVRPRTQRRPKRAGHEVRVAWADLGKVTRWVPSLRPLVDAVDGWTTESPEAGTVPAED
jgi:hypothetical protein